MTTPTMTSPMTRAIAGIIALSDYEADHDTTDDVIARMKAPIEGAPDPYQQLYLETRSWLDWMKQEIREELMSEVRCVLDAELKKVTSMKPVQVAPAKVNTTRNMFQIPTLTSDWDEDVHKVLETPITREVLPIDAPKSGSKSKTLAVTKPKSASKNIPKNTPKDIPDDIYNKLKGNKLFQRVTSIEYHCDEDEDPDKDEWVEYLARTGTR